MIDDVFYDRRTSSRSPNYTRTCRDCQKCRAVAEAERFANFCLPKTIRYASSNTIRSTDFRVPRNNGSYSISRRRDREVHKGKYIPPLERASRIFRELGKTASGPRPRSKSSSVATVLFAYKVSISGFEIY